MSTATFPLPCNKVSVTDIPHIYNRDGILGDGGQGVVHKLVYNSDKCKKAAGIPDRNCQCIYDNYNIIARKRDFSGTVNDEEISLLQKVIDIPNVNRYILHDDKHIYMEACSGGDLFDAIVGMGPFKEDKVAQIMFTLFHTVYNLHGNGVVHRDIKPDNILLQRPMDDEGLWTQQLQLIDFGHACESNEKGELTNYEMVGTPYYMAPELSRDVYTNKCDIWSLCSLMLILFTGIPFFNYEEGLSRYDIWKDGKSGRLMFNKFKKFNKSEYKIPYTLQYLQRFSRQNIWISDEGIDFILYIVGNDEENRPTAEQALCHPWLQGAAEVRLRLLEEQLVKAKRVKTEADSAVRAAVEGEKEAVASATEAEKEVQRLVYAVEKVNTVLHMDSLPDVAVAPAGLPRDLAPAVVGPTVVDPAGGGGEFPTSYTQKYNKYKAKYKALHTRR